MSTAPEPDPPIPSVIEELRAKLLTPGVSIVLTLRLDERFHLRVACVRDGASDVWFEQSVSRDLLAHTSDAGIATWLRYLVQLQRGGMLKSGMLD